MAVKFPSFLSFILDNPVRAFFADKEKLIEKIGLAEGMRILEVGSGSGFFTPSLSKTVGINGKVIAIDIQDEMIEKLGRKIEKKALNNVEPIAGDISRTSFIPDSIDFIFAYYCYHEFEDKAGAVKKFKEALKTGGYIFLCEPRFEVKFKEKEEMKKLFIEEGFLLVEEWFTLFSYCLKLQAKF